MRKRKIIVDLPRLLKDLGIEFRSQGSALWARCPSGKHPDREPSWKVVNDPSSEKHGLHFCFGCAFRGNVVTLVAHLRGIGGKEAYRWLRDCGLEIRRKTKLLEEKGTSLDISWWAGKAVGMPTVKLPLTFHPFGGELPVPEMVRVYLEQRETPIPIEQMESIGAGWCFRGRYKSRIVVPVRVWGELVWFLARDITGRARTPKLGPKNSSEGFLWALFGHDTLDRREGRIFLVEGWADQLKLKRMGYKNSVAVMTDRLTREKARLLSWVKRTIVVPDPDEGGEIFVQDVMRMLPGEILVADLPEGKDPAACDEDVLEKAISRASRPKRRGKARERKFDFSLVIS